MPTVEYLPVATGGAANVESQADFAGSGHQHNGFTAGVALSKQANKVWRQASMGVACIANFISNQLGIDVLDDGNLAALVTNFTNAIGLIAGANPTPGHLVPFADNAFFDMTAYKIFECTLTGDMNHPTIGAIQPYRQYIFMFTQDGAGGHNLNWPAGVPGDPLDGTPNSTTTAMFVSNGASVLRKASVQVSQ